MRVLFTSLFLCVGLMVKAQFFLNFQYGRSMSFSQRTAGVNDKGVLKISPSFDQTYAVGLAYPLGKKWALMYNLSFVSHGWILRMREKGETSYRSDIAAFSFEYDKTRLLYEHKIGALYTVFNKGKLKVNLTGGIGFYHTRCSSIGWTGERRIYITSAVDTPNAENYLLINKRDTRLYTFINTLVYAGFEVSGKFKKHEFGAFFEAETAFAKNYEHKVHYKRGDETGSISIKNSGLTVRVGVFFRPKIMLPVITIKRRVETPAETPAPQPTQ